MTKTITITILISIFLFFSSGFIAIKYICNIISKYKFEFPDDEILKEYLIKNLNFSNLDKKCFSCGKEKNKIISHTVPKNILKNKKNNISFKHYNLIEIKYQKNNYPMDDSKYKEGTFTSICRDCDQFHKNKKFQEKLNQYKSKTSKSTMDAVSDDVLYKLTHYEAYMAYSKTKFLLKILEENIENEKHLVPKIVKKFFIRKSMNKIVKKENIKLNKRISSEKTKITKLNYDYKYEIISDGEVDIKKIDFIYNTTESLFKNKLSKKEFKQIRSITYLFSDISKGYLRIILYNKGLNDAAFSKIAERFKEELRKIDINKLSKNILLDGITHNMGVCIGTGSNEIEFNNIKNIQQLENINFELSLKKDIYEIVLISKILFFLKIRKIDTEIQENNNRINFLMRNFLAENNFIK